jgi:hypothetical protein
MENRRTDEVAIDPDLVAIDTDLAAIDRPDEKDTRNGRAGGRSP